MQSSYSHPSQTPQPVQQNLRSQANIANNTATGLGILLLTIPVCLVLGNYFYKRHYRAYRAKVRLQQIEYLEKLWRISPRK